MKKTLIVLASIVALVVVTLVIFPEVLFILPAGQKLLLRLEGDKVATFYFDENSSSKDTIFMEGVIYSNTFDDMEELLDDHPTITTLVMVDVPGSVDDYVNLQASRLIRNHRINTYIPEDGEVASGGTDMFLAGYERMVHSTAKLGVHSWGGAGTEASDFPKDDDVHKMYLDYYHSIDIPTDFYWYTLEAAPADSIHWMTSEEISKFHVVTLSNELPEILELQKELSSDEYLGRGTGNNQKAQELIRSYFENIGLKKFDNSYNATFTFKTEDSDKKREGTNIVGYVTGKSYPDKYIVIGAHYDHLGVHNDTIYNGADDNASGTSALLTLAKYFSTNQPQHSIIFVAFDAEELGLHGSEHFVNHPPVSLSAIQLNINFDMISRNHQNEIYVVGTYPFPQFKPVIESVNRDSTLVVSYGHDDPDDNTKDYWMYSSDNGAFFKKGIPNITFSEEDHPDYHKHTDDFENTHPEFYQDVVEFIKNCILRIDENFPSSP